MIDKIVSDVKKSYQHLEIEIKGVNSNGSDVFEFHPEYLITACENEDQEYVFCKQDEKCDCLIAVLKQNVSFELVSSGGGSGGGLCVTIPKTLCIDAFRNIYDAIKDEKVNM
jgi:hypothetical protein